MKSWILYGPQGSGKTKIAGELAKRLGLQYVQEEWDGRLKGYAPDDTLHVVSVEYPDYVEHPCRAMSVDEARRYLGEPPCAQ